MTTQFPPLITFSNDFHILDKGWRLIFPLTVSKLSLRVNGTGVPNLQEKGSRSFSSRILTTTGAQKSRSAKVAVDSKGLGTRGTHKIIGEVFVQEKKHIITTNSDFKNQNHHPGPLQALCPDARIKGIGVGRWKQLYPPEEHGKNHINASQRRSLCFAKYKTVSLQIYGNNVTGAKGCHFESKKAHFSVALMASDVKANYTPTR